jgi:hypothetical protein
LVGILINLERCLQSKNLEKLNFMNKKLAQWL